MANLPLWPWPGGQEGEAMKQASEDLREAGWLGPSPL